MLEILDLGIHNWLAVVLLQWFSVACFGVRALVMFHLMCVYIIFSSVWVAEWPPFWKELITRLTIFLFVFLLIVIQLFPVLFLRDEFGLRLL